MTSTDRTPPLSVAVPLDWPDGSRSESPSLTSGWFASATVTRCPDVTLIAYQSSSSLSCK